MYIMLTSFDRKDGIFLFLLLSMISTNIPLLTSHLFKSVHFSLDKVHIDHFCYQKKVVPKINHFIFIYNFKC